MKSNEASLLVIVSFILAIFMVYFEVVQLQNSSFSDPIIKKDLLIIFFILILLIYSALIKSFSKAFVLMYPVLFELNRTLISLAQLLKLPPILKTLNIYIVDVIAIILFFILFDLKKVAAVFRFKPVYYYNIFIVIGILSVFWAMNPNAAIAYIPTIILIPVCYYVFLMLFQYNEKNIFYLSIGLFFSAMLSIIFVWPSYFGIQWFNFLLSRDSDATGSTANSVRAGGILARAIMALLLASLIPYLYNFGIHYFKRYRRYVHMIGMMLILTLVLTLNRMHFFATCLGICLILFSAIKQHVVKAYIGVITVGAVLFLGVVVYVVSLNGNDVENTIDRDTWEGRMQQYNAAFQNFEYSAGLGIGMNNFLVSPISVALLGSALGVDNGAFESGNTVHDDYLRVLAEYGVAGLIFYVLFFISTIKQRVNNPKIKPLVYGAKINIIVVGIVGLSSPALNHDLALIIIGMYLAIIKYYQDNNSAEKFLEITEKYC